MHVGKILLSQITKSLRVILPLLLALFLLISNNQILALTFTRQYTADTATVKSPPVTLNQGTKGSSSISTTHDYATVNSTAGFTFYENATNNDASQVFYPTSMNVINNSTALSGGISNLAVVDGVYVSFGEGSSLTPGFDFFFNFTGVSSLSGGFDYDLCEYYQGSTVHVVIIELYNFTSGSWITYDTFNGESGVVWHHIKVTATNGLIQNGIVMGSLNHTSTGISSHFEYVDYIALTPTVVSQVFCPSSMSVINNSTALSGGLSNLAAVDAAYVSFGEGSSVTPGFCFFFNFTGASSLSGGFDYDICEYYSGSTQHVVVIQLYNFTSGSWIKYETFNAESGVVWHHIKVTATSGLIQGGVVMGSMNHTSQGQASHNEFIDFISLTPTSQSSISSATTDFAVPTSSGSFTLAAGSSVLLYSPTFTSSNTIYAGSWVLDLWASASTSGALTVSFVSVDSSYSVVGTAASGTTGTIGSSKSEVVTVFSGSQVSVPSGGRLVANITNPSSSGITFTIYWGSGQPTNYQTPADYDYVITVTNSASTSYSVSLSAYSSSGISRLTNLTVTVYSPSTNQIMIINGAFTQSSGTTMTLAASSTLFIQVHASANSFGRSNVMLLLKYSPDSRPFANDVISLTVN